MKRYIRASRSDIDITLSYYEIETGFQSDAKIKIGPRKHKVDNVVITKDSDLNRKYPVLQGFAHDNEGHYDWDLLTPDDIVNFDLEPYMNGTAITNIEMLVQDCNLLYNQTF